MESKVTEIDALLRSVADLVVSINSVMDRLLSLLPRTAPIQAPEIAAPEIEAPRPEDISIQRALDEVLEYHRVHRPKNTTKNYEPKQKEWKAWCRKMGFKAGGRYLPGDYVDEGKLLLFIKDEVANRPPRRGQRLKAERERKRTAAAAELTSRGPPSKRKRGKTSAPSAASGELPVEGDDDDDEACSELVLMYNTVRSYCSAINELWAHQTSSGLHNAARPQRVAMTALKTSIARGQHQRRRDEFTDRGLATIRDGYVASQIPDLTRKIWGQCLGQNQVEQQFRTQLCFLFGNSMLLRLSNRLPMELPDLFSMSLPNEGPKGRGWCLVTVMDQGKTNQHGRLEYGAALRHRDYRSCLIGALATYFFWRWHCSGESFPCFQTSQDWYNIKVLKRDNNHLTESLSDSTAASWTRRLCSEAGIKSSKVTHAGQVSGARLAELNGVSEDQIRRGGRWNADQMTGCYLTTLPRAFMRGIADFDPDWSSSYYLPREAVCPPPALLNRVWPDLDRWQAAHLERADATERVEPNLAAGGFLELLQRLRVVFLQDSVLWRMEFPGHPIFRDPLFETAEYKAFELDVRGAITTAVEEDPHSIAIQKAVPAVNDRLRTMTAVIQSGQITHSQALRSLEGLMVSRIEQLTDAINDFVGGTFTCQFVPRSQIVPPPVSGAAFGPTAPIQLPVTALEKASQAPQYHMSRTIQTIPDLWQEWTVGLKGQPSIERLDDLYGSGWRSGPEKSAERQFYSRRKTLITEIRRLAAAEDSSFGDPYQKVVAQLEEQRIQAGASLSKVIDALKKP
ncbi:hypothetical protein CNMCM5793_002042 [Aspergillus hiratsukae]|uniref:Transcription activator GCR1-like domain-containing protein n=1 Tax=Aspergillus hiratsukae TaxID=1194566 RepID=A0A8H6PCB3_9EURO|nr:hypothetical protein CNMCM5793_002042 [Aspergillus hiratsukae]